MNDGCKNTPTFYASLMSALGYNAALFIFNNHMCARMSVADGSNPTAYYTDPDTEIGYCYCETTTAA